MDSFSLFRMKGIGGKIRFLTNKHFSSGMEQNENYVDSTQGSTGEL